MPVLDVRCAALGARNTEGTRVGTRQRTGNIRNLHEGKEKWKGLDLYDAFSASSRERDGAGGEGMTN